MIARELLVVIAFMGSLDLVKPPKWYDKYKDIKAEPFKKNVNDALVDFDLQHPDKVGQSMKIDDENVIYFLSEDGVNVNEFNKTKLMELFLKKSLNIEEPDFEVFEDLFNCTVLFSGAFRESQDVVNMAIKTYSEVYPLAVTQQFLEKIDNFIKLSFHDSDFTNGDNGYTFFYIENSGRTFLFYRVDCSVESYSVKLLIN